MSIAVITGSSGLIGSESASFFNHQGFEIVGIDNDMRRLFFGDDASNGRNHERLSKTLKSYTHYPVDIRDEQSIFRIFAKHGSNISAVIHTAAQPSHDWAMKEPFTDFSINALGTLILLEATRKYCQDATFIFTSSNKVYGDFPNHLKFVERETRWELDPENRWAKWGFDEQVPIDQSKHTLFGASKVSADVLVQEYGHTFGMKTVVFRGGCLTGPAHSGALQHGFLSYLIKCALNEVPYQILGYKGKQVRDNVHSYDLANAFWQFHLNPKCGEVYNIGGSRAINCSILEAITMIQNILRRSMIYSLSEDHRSGDHIWWVTDVSKFQRDYPKWKYRYGLSEIIQEMIDHP